jgi:putative ABC transport system permease protein
MTFSTLIFKIFKADIKKYKLFIFCNLLSIAILYSFLSISQNPQFMDSTIVDPMISSNIYAPTFLVLMFSGIFIPYSQNVFIKSRQRDYGILLTLGMEEKDSTICVLLENIILCVIALLSGLIAGTILSIIFLAFIRNIIGISNLDIVISFEAYKLTIIYTVTIFSISLIVNIIGIVKSTVLNKIKLASKAEIKKNSYMFLIILGIVLSISAFIIMVALYKKNSNIWLVSLLVSIIGSFLIFFNGEVIINIFKTKFYRKYLNHLFLISDIQHYYGKNKKIFFVNTWILFAVLFFIMFSLVTYPNFTNNANEYHPYHMIYPEEKDFIKSLNNDEIELIANKNNNSITFNKTIRCIRNNTYTLFCVDDINKIMKKSYKVDKGSFIYVYPYYINDGYEHDIDENTNNISIYSNNKSKQLTKQDSMITPLIGNVNCISEKIILVNSDDFKWISLYGKDYASKIILHLYNFENWENTDKIVNTVQAKLIKMNPELKNDDEYYSVSSRIKAYQIAVRSSNFLIFVIIYACVLLYFAAIIMVHFKLKMEYDDEKIKYFSLYRIGVKQSEIKKIISKKILSVYFVSFIYAAIINVLYAYYTNFTYGYGVIGILISLLTGFVFLIIHTIVYKLYLNNYYKNIVSEIL